MLSVEIMIDEGVTHLETFRSSGWRALGILCRAEVDRYWSAEEETITETKTEGEPWAPSSPRRSRSC